MPESLLERGWQALLLLSRAVGPSPEPVEFCFLRFGDEEAGESVSLGRSAPPGRGGAVAAVLLDPRLPDPDPGQADAVFRLEGLLRVRVARSGGFPRPLLRLFRLYLPYAFSAMRARALGRPFAISHFAQTLDGRIAAPSGESRWIGGRANFVHAHRMRALCDAVLVGARTVRRDRPRLSVRHVAGPQPARVVLGSSADGLEALLGAEGGPVILAGPGGGPVPDGVRRLRLAAGPDGFVPSGTVLRALGGLGIRSVYIEGGAFTTSRFLTDGALDVVQVHIAPLILGAGLSSFGFDAGAGRAPSFRLDGPAFTPVEDGLMLVGAPGRPAGEAAP